MQQTTVQESKTIRFGSGLVEVGEDIGTLVNLGAMREIVFEETWEVVRVMSDNAGEIRKRIKNHQAAVEGNLMEVNLTTLNLLRGGLDNYLATPAAEVTIAAESVTLSGTKAVRLKNKMGSGAEVSTIVVAGGHARNTDYVIAVDSAGYTTIARIAGGGISDGAAVSVGYKYTPNESITLSSGGKTTINPRIIRVTNVDEDGKEFRITVYKATNEEALNIEFPDDESDDPALVPIKLVGTLDGTRAAGEQLFEIYDEQGA